MGRGDNAAMEAPLLSAQNAAQPNPDWPLASCSSEIDKLFYEQDIDPHTIVKEHQAPASFEQYWKDFSYTCPNTGWSVRPSEHLISKRLDDNPYWMFGRLHFSGSITDDSQMIGDFNISIGCDPDGQLEMSIGSLTVVEAANSQKKEDWQRTNSRTGKGFGMAFIQHLEQMARQGGVVRSSVHATGVGGIFWAKAEYQPDPRDQVDSIAKAKQMIRRFSQDIDPTKRRELLRKLRTDSLIELAKIDDGQEYHIEQISDRPMTVGEYTLANLFWHGYKSLLPQS